ncbi:glycosyltransferase [Pseudahrensia aquimaris]|uniref:Glycosyltransferase n=1 Tax=Pseudahrensia aquimaris TaxID=744461 RepID=A0ABW3FI37_9HYPH
MRALIRRGAISEEDYYRCAAEELGLEFVPTTPSVAEPFLTAPPIEAMERMAFAVPVGNSRIHHIAPDMANAQRLKDLLAKAPGLRSRLKVTTRSANLDALEKRASSGLLHRAIEDLRNRMPGFSARQVVTPGQAVVLVIGLQILVLAVIFASGVVTALIHIFFTLSFFACGSLRLFAASLTRPKDRLPHPTWHKTNTLQEDERNLPVYSVLVALYKEAGQIDDLVRSLARIDWPREKLEIKLICEADDTETVDAVRHALRGPNRSHMALVQVPVSLPRTKPKALNYALPLCRGRCLVIYDAEDRPEPNQLRAAWSAFREGGDDLVCLQAPLIIHNHRTSWLPRLFAIEYSALFDGLLPALARLKLPLPLGGTSNHFRRAALEHAGGWDPYNVTKDADLGMRLARLGYRTATITPPTYEEAPTEWKVWRNQRTRWFKGWMQTWLVHMRHPIKLSRELGLGGTVTFHILVTGMIVSALVHPLLLYNVASVGFQIVTQGWTAATARSFFWFDLITIMLGYTAFAALAWRTLPIRGLGKLRRALWTVPAYWMLLSVAAWRALFHLMIKPHHCGLMYQTQIAV